MSPQSVLISVISRIRTGLFQSELVVVDIQLMQLIQSIDQRESYTHIVYVLEAFVKKVNNYMILDEFGITVLIK